MLDDEPVREERKRRCREEDGGRLGEETLKFLQSLPHKSASAPCSIISRRRLSSLWSQLGISIGQVGQFLSVILNYCFFFILHINNWLYLILVKN